jgi:colanic acid/amylovoran biosynthesis glycosyltransferase
MRVAFLLDRFPAISETYIVRQITGLLDLGHEVDIFAARHEDTGRVHPEVPQYDLMSRTTFVDVPLEAGYWEMPVWPLGGETWVPGAAQPIPNLRRVMRALPTLARCLRRAPRVTVDVLRPSEYGVQARSLSALYRLGVLASRARHYDVLHAHFGPTGLMFRFAGRLWQAPLVVSFHGYDFSTWPRRHGAAAYAPLFGSSALITVNSDYTRRQVESLGCHRSKIRRLSLGVDLQLFPFRARTLTPGNNVNVLSVGRLVEVKGHEFAIRAIAQVRTRVPYLHYDIVGEGPLRTHLSSLIAELGIDRHVTLHGAQDGDYVRRMLDAAHVFLMPSVTVDGAAEGQGLALQEAQAVGLPVIATEHGALPEGMVPGKSGFLARERDVAALAAELSHLIEQAARWPAMGAAGRAFVEQRYNAHALTRQLVTLYSEAASTTRR